MTDQLKKYLFEDRGTRIQTVQLTSAWQQGLAHQHYPDCVQRLLGEMVCAAVLLAGNIKFQGSLVLQMQGDGPVALAVAECSANLAIRATATLREGHDIPDDSTLQTLLNSHGQGRFIVLLDPDRATTGMQPYQGIVPLEGTSVAEVLEHYMRDSEQLETRLWFASSSERCSGLLLQRLPAQDGTAITSQEDTESSWERAHTLAGTLHAEELLSADVDIIVHRLFWEETLIVFEPQSVHWHCPCTRNRVANMLRMLGREEVEDILVHSSQVSISCSFCGKPYKFDAIDCAALFIEHLNIAQGGHKSVH